MAVKRYNGSAWVTEAGGVPAFLGGFRNRIINGDFRINQRGYSSATNLASGAYGFDRWKSTFTNTTLTFTSAPQGQVVTINSGGSVEQIIERANMPAGTYVLSWTGTATGRVYNTGATPPSYAASPIVVTIDGTANVEVEFTASGGTRTLQNVQLEAGSVPTTFEYRPIGSELELCQRYYYRWESSSASLGMTISSTWYGSPQTFPVQLRTSTPTITTSSPGVLYGAGITVSVSSFSAGVTMAGGLNVWQFTASLGSAPASYTWTWCTFNTHSATFNAEL